MLSAAKKRAIAIIFAIVFVGSLGFGVSAQDQSGGSGLIISPTRTELEVSPGGLQKIKVTLQNVSGVDIIAKAEINDFESNGKTGEPRIFPGSEKHGSASIRNFLSNVNDVELKKDQKKDFEIDVAIPTNASPGAYYGIVRYAAIPVTAQESGGNQISLTASVGTLILLTVPGDITEQIQIQSIKAESLDDKGNPVARSFFTKKPSQVSIEIKNNGNGFSKPLGKVTVSKGGKNIYTYELNQTNALNPTDSRANILPNSTRIFTNKIEKVNMPGRYKVSANISHGSGGEVVSIETSFWYVPAWCLYLLIGGLLAIIAAVYLVYRRKFGGKGTVRRRKKKS